MGVQWAYPDRWVWLLAVPALIGFLFWARRRLRRDMERFAGQGLLAHLTDSVLWQRRVMRAVLLVIGLCSVLLALVGPQWGFEWEEVKRRGVDILIAIDVSKSMLAEDVKPNRLERAKLAVRELVPMLQGDRIGLVLFSGSSFVQCPLTADYGAFLMILDEANPDLIPRGGTALADAVRTSLAAFEAASTGDKALVLITDGEDHEGDALAAVRDAVKAGARIFCVGMGTPEGELIPITDAAGGRTFLKDRQGRTVKSRLDETTLAQMAQETGGSYVRATPTSLGLDLLYRDRISKLSPSETEDTLRQRYQHRFQWPLAFGWLLLMLEMLFSDRKQAR